MTRRARRILITSLVLFVATIVVLAVFLSPPRPAPSRTAAPSQQPTATAPAQPATPPAETDALQAAEQITPEPQQPPAQPVQPMTGLRAVAPGNDIGPRDQPPQPLGSLDPRVSAMRLDFTRAGAGIDAIPFSDLWETAAAKRQAHRYFQQLHPGEPIDSSKLDESQRYVLVTTQPLIVNGQAWPIPVMAAHSVVVNGSEVGLLTEEIWSETAPGRFETQIVDEQGTPILHITRQYNLGVNFDIALQQHARNLSSQPLEVQWRQYGPTDLPEDRSGYIDRRRFEFGYLPDPVRQPGLVLSGDFEHDRSEILKLDERAREATDPQQRDQLRTLWPNPTSASRAYQLSWFASMNRYFSLAIHPAPSAVAANQVELVSVSEIGLLASASTASNQQHIFTSLKSPAVTITPGAEAHFNLGVYAGPLDRGVLALPPMAQLTMVEMIRYSMGGCCNFLSFQWLAKLLLNFLAILHDYIVFDWGVAIIVLVIVVRTLLHPLTKKSQINMQRFGKQMGAMKPEIDKLQKKYGSDPKRMQAEQMKLMREHGVNPFQMLGCLPMFLQTPIWIALWAMLYLAFEIRHQPAFYGVFQMIGDWKFLGDLSSPDSFLVLPGGGFTIPLVGVEIPSLNLLPLLLGLVFYFQQKYMSPPPTPNMTPEQLQQQRIMKVMMVLLMPIFLYKAPSGLTLYIFTSSCIGIMESKYIRSHITQLDLEKPQGDSNGGGGSGPRDTPPRKPKGALGRAWAEKLEAARAKRQAEPPRSFKKRK